MASSQVATLVRATRLTRAAVAIMEAVTATTAAVTAVIAVVVVGTGTGTGTETETETGTGTGTGTGTLQQTASRAPVRWSRNPLRLETTNAHPPSISLLLPEARCWGATRF
jgi:hypothetical protein